MKKDVLISIKGVQVVDGERDSIELFTTGSYYKKGGHYYISYQESEATGFNDTRTTLKIEDENRITLLRSGKNPSQLIVEKGRRNQCYYGTEAGSLLIGVSGDKIVSRLTDQGGDLEFKYSLDINTSLASENEVFIQVKECVK